MTSPEANDRESQAPGGPNAGSAARPPRVFVSHASEDKERFVEPFARLLRQSRVDAWLDKWEIGPGDSLEQRIYAEGLGGADVVVAVVSPASVNKRWVRDEIAVATVRRVQGLVKIIPVVLDGVTPPVSLQGIAWVTASTDDHSAVRDAAQRVIAQVFGLTEKPPLGVAPGYASASARATDAAAARAGLARIDALVLRELTRRSLADPHAPLGYSSVPYDTFAEELHREFDLPEQDVADAVSVLEEHGYVHARTGLFRGRPFDVGPTTGGVDLVIEGLVEDYELTTRRIGAAIVNRGMHRCEDIAAATGTAEAVVAHVMHAWADRGWLKLSAEVGVPPHLWDVAPHLRRWLAG